MVKIAIGSRGKKYYKYGVYTDLKTAIRTAKYFKNKCRSKWKIDEIWTNNKKYYCLYLTNAIRC